MELKKQGFLILFTVITACGPNTGEDSPFKFQQDKNGIALTENGKAVFYYQKEPKTLTGEYICNHYIHPLYSLNGDTLTEEFPIDHPYHRGIFWSWHQFYVDSASLGDEWIMENISHEISEVQEDTKQTLAILELNVLWRSALLENGKVFMKEKTHITVFPTKAGIRKIDFEISLLAQIPGLSLGGSDDEKGYGGFCARLKLPENLAFNSSDGPVEPKTLQVRAGSWMNFTGTFGRSAEQSGVAILCHPSTPNFPAPWILRQKTSMQNIVFPGRERVEISTDQPTILRYRLIVHEGSADHQDLARLQTEFEEIHF